MKTRIITAGKPPKRIAGRSRALLISFAAIFGVVGLYFLFHGSAATTAPALGGCQMFPSDYIWNYNISNLPVSVDSANYINHLGASTPLANDFGPGTWGIPYNVVPASQPFVTVHFTTYADKSVPGPYPIPANAIVETGSDHHLLVLDQGDCKLYEMFQASPNSDGSWTAESGVAFDLSSYALISPDKVSADAGNFALLPGLVRYDEVVAGAINHAIRFVLADPQKTYVWPATHSDGTDASTSAPPYGTRFRLKSDVDISSFSKTNQVILTALKQYGMIIADKNANQTDVEIVGSPDNRWDYQDLANLNKISLSDFEAVDESGLMVSATSGQVKLPALAGDVNGDGHVNIYDLSLLLSHFGQANTTLSMGDVNNDRKVTVQDLSILLSNYGK